MYGIAKELVAQGCDWSQIIYINFGDAEDLETRSLFSFAEKSEEAQRLIIVTNEEERTITKDELMIEVVPVHKFLLGEYV